MTTKPGYAWDGTQWVSLWNEATVSPVKYQASEPSSPSIGDIWIDSDADVPVFDQTNYSTTAQMNTAISNASSLVLLNTTTVSAVSSISLNNVFTSSYNNYLVTFNGLGSAAEYLRFRFRANGTDYTATGYNVTKIERAGSGFFTDAGVANLAGIGFIRLTKSDIVMNIFSPYVANTNSSFVSNGIFLQQGSQHGNYQGSSSIDSTSQYDGFTIFPDLGTITGTIKVYGYK